MPFRAGGTHGRRGRRGNLVGVVDQGAIDVEEDNHGAQGTDTDQYGAERKSSIDYMFAEVK